MKNKDIKSAIDEHQTKKTTDHADNWILRLYVAGQTPKCVTAFNNLKTLCENQLKGKYHIEVIDLFTSVH